MKFMMMRHEVFRAHLMRFGLHNSNIVTAKFIIFSKKFVLSWGKSCESSPRSAFTDLYQDQIAGRQTCDMVSVPLSVSISR